MTEDVARAALRLAHDADDMHRLARAAAAARARIATWPSDEPYDAAGYVERIVADAMHGSAAGVIARTRGLAETMNMGRARERYGHQRHEVIGPPQHFWREHPHPLHGRWLR